MPLLLQLLLCSLQLLGQAGALSFEVLAAVLRLAQPVLVFPAFTGQLLAVLGHPGLRFLLQLHGQLRHQVGQLVTERYGSTPMVSSLQLLQIAVDGGFRAGIAQFDPYSIDAGMLAPRQ
ncbi:hypothetical protein D9M68_869380 [compost metagenome]